MAFSSFFGSRDVPATDDYGTVEIAWQGDVFVVPLPHPKTTLGAFKDMLADRTGVPKSQMKLISHGFQLKDDTITLDRYRLYDEDTRPADVRATSGLFKPSWASRKPRPPPRIVMLGSPETEARVTDRGDSRSYSSAPPPSASSRRPPSPSRSAASGPPRTPSAASEPVNELTVTARIAQLLDTAMSQHLPTIEALEGGRPVDNPRAAAIASELLLQTLLKLDGVQLQASWNSARQARKEAVRDVQDALDRIDAVKAIPPASQHHQSTQSAHEGGRRGETEPSRHSTRDHDEREGAHHHHSLH